MRFVLFYKICYNKKTMKINSQRLSKLIMNKDSKNTTDRLLTFYDALSKEQRSEIKNIFINNSKKKYDI